MPVGLYVDIPDSADKQVEQAVARLLQRISGVVLVDGRDQLPGLGDRTLLLDVATPTADEQLAAWCQRLPDLLTDVAQQLVGQFDLNLSAINRIGDSLDAMTVPTPDLIRQQVWNGCRQHTRPKLEELAQRIDVKATWDDIVLPEDELGLLHQITAQVRHRGTVLDQWGFRNKMKTGAWVSPPCSPARAGRARRWRPK